MSRLNYKVSYFRIKKVVLITFLLFTFLTYKSFSQVNNIHFQTISNGLSNPHVKCVLKDSKGFIWFGTSEGLNKFDGSNFTVYENSVNDSCSLINNVVNTILEDHHNNLWIGTGNGLCVYNREKNNFKVFKEFGRKIPISVATLFEDANHNIWIGSSGIGLFIYNPQNDSLYSYVPKAGDATAITSNFVGSIVADRNQRIWIGTRNGLDYYDDKNGSFVHFNGNTPLLNDLKTGYVKDLVFDEENNLWIGTYGKGLYKLTEKDNDWQIEHYQASNKPGSLSTNDILSLAIDQKGNLWIGTENGGLNVLPHNSGEFIVYKNEDGNQQSISSNSIWSIYQDNTSIIWIGTYNHGVSYIDDRIEKFNMYQKNPFHTKTLTNNNVMSFSEDKNGNIWIATDGGGVSSFNPKTRSFTNKIDNEQVSSKAVMAVLCDSKQRVWIGTWAGGIDLFETSGKRIKNFELETYNRPGNIFSFYEDKSGQIWAGSAGKGLLKYNAETGSFDQVIDESGKTHLSGNAFVNKILEDSEHNFWIGIPYSLIRIRNINGERSFTEFRHSTTPGTISGSGVTYVFEDSRNNLWVGTDDGLNLFNKADETFTTFRKEDGLANNTIYGILEDNNRCLWISTSGGLSKFDPQLKTFKNYYKEDGLLSNSFNQRSCMKTESGEFYFGNNNGFVSFFPDSIKMNTYIPPVYFTDFKIFNNSVAIGAEGSPLSKHIAETQQITLNYKQTSFTIEFVALNYTRAAKNQYAYMLEGFDKDWVYSGTQRYASYTNIDAGKYTFKVKGSNNEGIWNTTPVQLEIKVLPPYWKTNWAYLFYFVVVVLILWGFLNLLIIKSNQAARLKLEKIHHEKSEELNKMKIQFFANISHEFRTPLSLILAPLKQIIDTEPLKGDVKSRMDMIFRNANRLFGLVNELMDFTKSEEGRLKMMVHQADIVSFASDIHSLFLEEARQRNIRYSFDTEFESQELWFDKRKMEKIISNLLSNAFKFTPDSGEIALKITKETIADQQFAVLSVHDNGIGISQEHIGKVFDRFFQSPDEDAKHIAGTGIGLALVKSLVELHHGTINVTSTKGESTCFTVKIPLGNSHFNKNEIMDNTSLAVLSSGEVTEHESKEETSVSNVNAPLLLIVEDNADLREYLASTLGTKYKIIRAADGAEGVMMAKESTPDLIISDVSMPRLSGIELCKIIKDEMSTSHIPVILLTSKTSTPDIIEGIEKGADAYLTKPFDIKHLEVTIEKTIETRRKLYQRFSQDLFFLPAGNTDNTLDKKFMDNIIEYIDENLSDSNITVENLAAHVLMSRSNVYRKIKALTGQSATEFIRFARLKKAVQLLEKGQNNISEIAYKVGFSSPGYFAKCFKDQYGKSPSDFILSKTRTPYSEMNQ